MRIVRTISDISYLSESMMASLCSTEEYCPRHSSTILNERISLCVSGDSSESIFEIVRRIFVASEIDYQELKVD